MPVAVEDFAMRWISSHRTAARLAWTVFSILVAESMICALAIMPVLVAWNFLVDWLPTQMMMRIAIVSALVLPSYAVFVLCLVTVAGVATRLTGMRTPPDSEMRIGDMTWPLLRWARFMVRLHIVRVLAGSFLRGSPIWTAYLRLAGARVGRHVFVNSIAISDPNLLEFGDDVVIGGDVHISGHTVEGGVVKTGTVRLGRNVTIGVGTVIEIGVEIGDDTQVGALSFIPKHTKLSAGALYAGIPVKRIDRSPDGVDVTRA
jgi:acetyltransferase-like isoleucine patch superfamily enzyme